MLWKNIMKEPLVSTLICTYNAENTIHWALQSVMDQTYENQEILILDNNSKDNTLDILNDYQKKDKRIKIFSLWKNLWPYKWLNYLLDQSKWKYVAIQDHDDVRHPDKLKKQVEFLENNEKYIWCGCWFMDYYSHIEKWHVEQWKWEECNKVFHTSLVFRNGNYRYDKNNDYFGDVRFMKYVLCENKKRMYKLQDILLIHYMKRRGENLSSCWFKTNIQNIKRFWEVSPHNLYHVCLLIYLTIVWIFPKKIKILIDWFLLKIFLNDKNNIENIIKKNESIKTMMGYFN